MDCIDLDRSKILQRSLSLALETAKEDTLRLGIYRQDRIRNHRGHRQHRTWEHTSRRRNLQFRNRTKVRIDLLALHNLQRILVDGISYCL